ncbi:hypothetical protein GH141_00340 [bacterium]|nr:hypothetical protein [bacterium]
MPRKGVLFSLGVIALTLIPLRAHAGWMKTYGGEGDEEGYFVEPTSDGGYIVAASYPLWLVKLDSNGDTLWTKTHDSISVDYSEVHQTSDGGFITVGDFWIGPMEQEYRMVILKTDENGDELWRRIYDQPGWDYGSSIQETSDGGFIIVGGTGSIDDKVWLLKTDFLGDTIWTRTYGNEVGGGSCVRQTSDGGYIIMARNRGDNWLIKTDSIGDTLWTRTYGSPYYNDQAWCVQETNDGGYIIAARYADTMEQYDLWLIKTDNNGDSVWTRRYDRNDMDFTWWIEQTSDGGYIIPAYTMSYDDDFGYLWLIKTDGNGDTTWSRDFDEGEWNMCYCGREATDGYIISGFICPESAGNKELWVIKTDANGYVYGIDERPVVNGNFDWEILSGIGHKILLRYSDHSQGFHAAVFDATGRKVGQIHAEYASGTITWGAAAPPGVYFIKPISGTSSTRKAVLIR